MAHVKKIFVFLCPINISGSAIKYWFLTRAVLILGDSSINVVPIPNKSSADLRALQQQCSIDS